MRARPADMLWNLFLRFWNRPLFGNAQGIELPHPQAAGVKSGRLALIIAIILAAVAGLGSYVRSGAFAPVLYSYYGYGDAETGLFTGSLLFDGDPALRVHMMDDRFAPEHQSSAEHPLLSTVLFAPAKLFKAVGFSSIEAARFMTAGICALWTALLFALLRLWGCRLGDAVLLTVLGSVSGAAMVWHAAPESFGLGSATIMLAFIFTMWPRRVPAVVRYAAAMTVTVSITVTNVMAALFAAVRKLTVRDIWIAGVSAFFIVVLAWSIQKNLFPQAEFFLPPRTDWAQEFTAEPTLSRAYETLRSLYFSAMVIPDVVMASGEQLGLPTYMTHILTVQNQPWAGLLGVGSALIWGALLSLGLWAALKVRSGIATLAMLTALGQTALHLVFGLETFLYTLHMAPLLVIIAASATFTRARPFALALTVLGIVFIGANNWRELQVATEEIARVDDQARAMSGIQPDL